MADKFKTLEYNFDETNFPAKYEAKGFKLNGELIPNKGDDSAEEMLWFYAASKNRNGIDDNFNANFFMDLKPRLTPNQQKLSFPKDFQKVIDEMFNMNEAKKEAKKARSKEEKDAEKKLKESLKEKYGYGFDAGEYSDARKKADKILGEKDETHKRSLIERLGLKKDESKSLSDNIQELEVTKKRTHHR